MKRVRDLVIGAVVGIVLATGVPLMAGSYERSPQQQKFDYYRERQQQLDIKRLRQIEEQRAARERYSNPCK